MITGSNYTHMPAHWHTHTNKLARSTVLQENKHIPHPPARLLPWPFLFRKEDKYPCNRKKPAPDAFSTVHCFNTCIYLRVWIYSLSAAARFVLNGKWKDLWRYCGNISTPCLTSALTNELFACELGGGRLYSRGGWFVCPASAPQWKDQFINCSPVRMKDPYNTIQRWGEGIRREARILFTQGVRVDTVLQESTKYWKCRQYAKPSSEPRLDFMGP